MMEHQRLLKHIRILIVVFMVGLIVSGLTAFPLESEIRALCARLPDAASIHPSPLTAWLLTVQDGIIQTNRRYPFIAYGTDWLAFAHLVIAILFIGPLRDPVKNV